LLSISVVVVNYNSKKFLDDNIKSLLAQTVPFHQIIIVDNNSSDGSERIPGRYKDIIVVRLPQNRGYSSALNTGIRMCESDLVLAANSDISLDPDFNSSVTEKFHRDREVDMLSPLILRFGGDLVDSAGQTFSRALFPVERGFGTPADSHHFTEEKIFSVCGAATVFRKSSLETLKLDGEYYDESFFMFWEDFDIGWRATLYGQVIKFFPDAKVFHYRGGTMKKSFLSRFSMALGRSSEIKFHLVKNRYLTLIKNFRFADFPFALPFIILKDLVWTGLLTLSSPKIIIKLIRSGSLFRTALKRRRMIKKNE
jgi:GT2 family glycosyltransferase